MRLDYISKLKTSEFIQPNRLTMLNQINNSYKNDFVIINLFLILPIFSSRLIYSLLSNIKPNYPQLDSHKNLDNARQ